MVRVPTYYRIDGVNESFKTLKDAKYYIWFAYTDNERIKYFGKEPSYISGFHEDEWLTSTEIKISKEGKVSFGKAKKI